MVKGNKNSNTTLHDSIRESKDQPDSKRAKLECENCQAWVTDYVFPKHIASCNLYHKFMKKNAVGFECKICPSMAKHQKNMISHIKEKHQDYVTSKACKLEENEKPSMRIENINDEEISIIQDSLVSSPESSKENNQLNKDLSEKKTPKTSKKKTQFGQESSNKNSPNPLVSPKSQQDSSKSEMKQKSILNWIVKT